MSRKMAVVEISDFKNFFDWTTSGTARSIFEENCENEYLKGKNIFHPLNKSLKNIRQQFANLNIGTELFFQAYDFLNWIYVGIGKKRIIDQYFIVILSGFLFMRRANIQGSNCIPWNILKNQITSILLNLDFSKNELKPSDWKKWLLKSFTIYNYSLARNSKQSIFLEKNSRIYFYKNWLIESELVSLIRNRAKIKIQSPKNIIIKNSIKSILETNPIRYGEEAIELSIEQKKALFLSISSPLLIITGGPGTGKTSLAVIILRLLKRLGLAEKPALVAPTGRASKRIFDSVTKSLNSIKNLQKIKFDKELLKVASESKTIHRLLGYNPSKNSFKYHKFEPLEHDLLIIDEVSMIDQKLMISLLKAAYSMLPYHYPVPRIILIGDPNQLPSVGSGSVLSDLISFSNKNTNEDLESNYYKIVRLLRSFRQDINDHSGRNIIGVAETIKEFSEKKSIDLLFKANSNLYQETINSVNSLRDVFLEKVSFLNQENSIIHLREFAFWWVEKFLSNEEFCSKIQKRYFIVESDSSFSNINFLFNYLDQFRILTVTQVLPTGAKAINQMIRKIWITKNKLQNFSSEHYPGEPVMVTKNDYNLNLYNGDIGIFLKFVNPENGNLELKVVFQVDGEFKTFYEYELFDLQPAYAITVHKSQGSEYNNLALILPNLKLKPGSLDLRMQNMQEIITNQMLYTALTRAKKSVLILGRKKVLEFFVLNKVLRFSGLGNIM